MEMNLSLLNRITASPTAFHAVDTARRQLEEAGYAALVLAHNWQLVGGGK